MQDAVICVVLVFVPTATPSPTTAVRTRMVKQDDDGEDGIEIMVPTVPIAIIVSLVLVVRVTLGADVVTRMVHTAQVCHITHSVTLTLSLMRRCYQGGRQMKAEEEVETTTVMTLQITVTPVKPAKVAQGTHTFEM